MRSAAERVLAEEGQGQVGPAGCLLSPINSLVEAHANRPAMLQGKLLTFFLGNGPAGHCWQQNRATFYHRAQLIKGSLLLNAGSAQGADYAWLSKAEVLEQTHDPGLRLVLDGMLW